MSLLSLLSGRTETARRPRTRRAHFLPGVEDMESRLVLSAAGLTGHAALAPAAAVQTNPQIKVNLPVSITGINVTGVTQNATTGVLTVVGSLTGSLLNQNFTTPFTATITPATSANTCPVLHLALEPIHLSLLGLNVDTSAICLDITATHGGGLLGDLLCGGLENILGGLSGGTLNLTGAQTALNGLLNNTSLLGGLTDVLGGAFSHAGTPAVSGGTTILNLSVGPVDLSLLGLNVHLDNCNNGPVTVKITATPGGGLLGDLLSGLNNALSGGLLSNQDINALLRQIIGIVKKA